MSIDNNDKRDPLGVKEMKRGLTSLIITILLLATILPALTAIPFKIAKADDVPSSVSVNGQVTVQATTPTVSFQFYSDSSYSTTTTKFTPQTPVYMKISVSGDNPLEEATITVQLFADNSSNSAVGTPPSQTSPEKYVTFTISYDSNNGQWQLTADTGGSTTWDIHLDTNKDQPDPTSSSGDFYVVIVFGKTAREANTGDTSHAKDWDVIVTATIGSGSLAATGQNSGYGYTVYFYSEISTSASTVDFGTLTASSSGPIQYVDGNSAHSFSVHVIANGFYDLKPTASATWSDSNGHQISLVAGTPGNQQFALLVDDEGDTNGNPTHGVYATTDVNTANPFVDNANPTTENGFDHTIYIEISLGSDIYTGTYSGTITINVVDGA